MSAVPQPVAMLSPDNSQAKMVPAEQMSDAQDAGWAQASKMVNPNGEHKWVPNEQAETLKAKGWTPIEADGSFHIQPTEGESFADTMKRAANAGQWLSNHPEVNKPLMENEVKKGLKYAPIALAAGPAIAGAQLSAVAGAAALPGVVPAGVQGAKAVTAWAAKNPVQAYILYQVIKELLPGGRKAVSAVKGMPGE